MRGNLLGFEHAARPDLTAGLLATAGAQDGHTALFEQAQQSAAGGASGGGAQPSDDEVADAEIVDDDQQSA